MVSAEAEDAKDALKAKQTGASFLERPVNYYSCGHPLDLFFQVVHQSILLPPPASFTVLISLGPTQAVYHVTGPSQHYLGGTLS